GWVPTTVAMTLLNHAVAQTGDANLGLHLAERAELSSFDVHFYAMASSSTLGAAYERLCRYQRLIHETSRVELGMDEDRAKLRHTLVGGAAAPRQTAEFLLTAWVRAGRIVTGVEWKPHAVHSLTRLQRIPVNTLVSFERTCTSECVKTRSLCRPPCSRHHA